MEVLPKAFRLWLVWLLVAKVYAVWASPVPGGAAAAYPKTAGEKPRTSNYFIHDPYGPNTYAFGYEIDDAQTHNVQFRDERRYLNGSVVGSFGYVRPDGRVQVTHYKADEEDGYSAQSQSYAPGDERVETVWPTQRPELLKDRHETQPTVKVVWDPKSHLNVSVDQVEHEVTKELKQQHGLDLNHINVAQDVLQPAVLDIINGKTPLQMQPNGSLAFQTLHNFVAGDLPLVPFELPAKQLIATTTTGPVESVEQQRYNKAKSNNDEKAPQVTSEAAPSTTLPPPKQLESRSSNATSWYQRIIQANRREFLEHLPNLN